MKGERLRTIYRVRRNDSIKEKRDIYGPIPIIVPCLIHNIMGVNNYYFYLKKKILTR